MGGLGIAERPAQLVGLPDGYLGYVEGPERALRGEGEAARTCYGPDLAASARAAVAYGLAE